MSKVLIIEFQEQAERFLLEFFKKVKVKTHSAENEAEILARLSPAQREEWNDLKEALEWSKKSENGKAEGKTFYDKSEQESISSKDQKALLKSLNL